MRWDYDTLGGGRTLTGNSLQSDVSSGLSNIGELMRNPGGLNPNIADAIRARLSMESDRISQNFRGIGQNQAGMAARTNAPVSIKNALSQALDVSQERAQRDARRTAMVDSEQLRRSDVGETYNILGTILDYINSAKGIGAGAQANAMNANNQRNAAVSGALGSFASSLAQYYKPSGGSTPTTATPQNSWDPGYYVTR
jgi:hypothetical protein